MEEDEEGEGEGEEGSELAHPTLNDAIENL